jgi:DNA-binding response OmpR family regulator
MAKILIVDDDRSCATILARFLAGAGYDVKAVMSGHDALALGESFVPDLLVSDWLLQDGLDGITVAKNLLERYSTLRIIFITGLPREQLEAKRGEIKGEILEKPLDIEELLNAVKSALSQAA